MLSPEACAALEAWFARDRPAEVARSTAGGEPGVALAVTLPASRWLARIELVVARDAVHRVDTPPLLSDALHAAPPAWVPPLAELDRVATAVGVPLSVTGTLAWQHHTGETYVTDSARVDLLFQPRTHEALVSILDVLRARDGWGGPRLGGEVVLGRDDHVSWVDLARGRRRVLVKGAGREDVADVAPLLASLG